MRELILDHGPERVCRHKQAYLSKGEARDAAKNVERHRGLRLKPYRCNEEGCPFWHLTSPYRQKRRRPALEVSRCS